MSIYIKTKMTAVPKACHSCQYYEHITARHHDGTIEHIKKCLAVKPPYFLGRIDALRERIPNCPLREHGGAEDFDGLHFANPYTTRLIKSMKDLEKFAERFYKAQQAAEAEEGDS